MASGEGNNNRPFSLSKDEALARMLQEEEYSAVHHEDEQLARRLQGNMMFDSDEDSSHLGAGNRPPLRAMTPITQLFTTLVNAGLQQNPRQARRRLGLLQLSSDEEANNSDSDSTADEEDQEPDTARTGTSVNTSSSLNSRGRGGRGTARSTRGRMGYRPSETTVSVSTGRNIPSESPRSMFSTSSDPPSSRTPTTTTTIRGNRLSRGGVVTRGIRRPRRVSTTSTTNSESNESRPNATSTSQITSRAPGTLRSVPPLSMEPSVPPLSLAINQPELPDGEMEPEIVILDRGPGGNDAGFLHIMRDPMLLLLFLMGRTPHLLVPDDIDPTDYEALWDLAERLGEVKNRGLSDKELESLSTKKYRAAVGRAKVNVDGPQCQVCLTEYKAGENLVNLPCKHEYHDKCIKEWLKRNASCPICRHELKSGSKEKS